MDSPEFIKFNPGESVTIRFLNPVLNNPYHTHWVSTIQKDSTCPVCAINPPVTKIPIVCYDITTGKDFIYWVSKAWYDTQKQVEEALLKSRIKYKYRIDKKGDKYIVKIIGPLWYCLWLWVLKLIKG